MDTHKDNYKAKEWPDDEGFLGECDYCGRTTIVKSVDDPYVLEVHNEHHEITVCNECYNSRHGDV